MAILFSFIIQAVSYEFRSKPGNIFGRKTFDVFLLLNGLLGPFLIGVAVATFFTGANFSLNQLNQVTWQNEWRGLEAVWSLRNLSLGFAVLFLARLLGLMYIINSVDDDDLIGRSRKCVLINAIPFLVSFLFFVVTLLISDGYVYGEAITEVTAVKFRYLHNLLQMPPVLIMFLLGTVLVLISVYIGALTKSTAAIWYGGAGTILAVLALFLIAGYNNTAFYPSLHNLDHSLTIRNASSSWFTLRVMFFVSLAIPFVVAYIWVAWKAVSNRRIDAGEMETDGHKY
jgi:cytochrome d ubiquinol oxidase subunit II